MGKRGKRRETCGGKGKGKGEDDANSEDEYTLNANSDNHSDGKNKICWSSVVEQADDDIIELNRDYTEIDYRFKYLTLAFVREIVNNAVKYPSAGNILCGGGNMTPRYNPSLLERTNFNQIEETDEILFKYSENLYNILNLGVKPIDHDNENSECYKIENMHNYSCYIVRNLKNYFSWYFT